ncbi:MAG: permease-like cell division protein FtsX [Micrococcaceae bacterium]
MNFFFKETLRTMRRNLSLVISVVIVSFISLLFVGSSFLFHKQVEQLKGYWYDKVQVAVYLCDDQSQSVNCPNGAISQAQKDNIENVLKSTQGKQFIKNYYFESKDEAYKHFKEQFSNSSLGESVTSDAMPESFRLNLYDPNQYDQVTQLVKPLPGVDRVVDQHKTYDRMVSTLNVMIIISFIIGALTLVAGILLMSTTIRLSAVNRTKETFIMRMIGAKSWQINLPLLGEIFLSTLIGTILAVAALSVVVVVFVQGMLSVDNPSTPYIGTPQLLQVIFPLIILGAIISVTVGYLNIRKMVRV